MKIFCIGNPYPYVWKITPGKTYDLLDLRLRNGNIAQYIIDDVGSVFNLKDGIETYPNCFKTREEIREEKLKELGV